MKNSILIGLRSAVAASGVALLMFVAGCGGSDDASGDDDQATTQGTEASDTAAEEGAGDGATEEDSSVHEGAEDEDADEGAGAEHEASDDEGSSNAVAGDLASPGDDFDPCTAISADDVNGVLGTDMGEGTAGELGGVASCTFVEESTGDNLVVQWAATEGGTLDEALSMLSGPYSDLGEPQPVTVTGTSEAAVVTAEMQGATVKFLIATADGGSLQVLSTSSDFSNDQAVQIAEATLAGA